MGGMCDCSVSDRGGRTVNERSAGEILFEVYLDVCRCSKNSGTA